MSRIDTDHRIEIVPSIGQFGGTQVAFSPDGRLIATGTGTSVKLWDRATGRLARTLHDPAGTRPFALSPDGLAIATGGWRSGTLTLWDVSSGAKARVLHSELGSEFAILSDAYLRPISAIAFSPDGTRIVAGRKNLLNVWDVPSGRMLCERTIRDDAAGVFEAVAFSPDGRQFVTAGRDGLQVRDAETGAVQRQLGDGAGSVNWETASAIAVAPEGRRILGVRGPTLAVWDLGCDEVLCTIEDREYERIVDAVFSTDGRLIFSGSAGRYRAPRARRTWFLDSALTWIGKNTPEALFARSRAGEIQPRLAARGRPVKVWRAPPPVGASQPWYRSFVRGMNKLRRATLRRLSAPERGRLVAACDSTVDEVASLALSSDGKHLVAGNPSPLEFALKARKVRYSALDGVPELLDIKTRASVGSLRSHIRPLTALAFASDGSRFVAASYERYGTSMLHLWDAGTGQLVAALPQPQIHVTSVALLGSGRHVVVGGGLTGGGKSLSLWDPATGALHRMFAEPKLFGSNYWTYAMALSPDERRLVSGSSDNGEVRVWDTATGELVRSLPAYSGALAFSADGTRLLSGSWGSSIDMLKLWDLPSGALLQTFDSETPTGVNAVALSADGFYALAAGQNGAVMLWQVGTDGPPILLAEEEAETYSVAFSPDGTCALVGSSDGTVSIRDTADGRHRKTLHGHTAAVTCVRYSPDGKRVLSAGDDSTIRLWDVEAGELLATFIADDNRWLTLTPAGFFSGSPGIASMLSAVRGREVRPLGALSEQLHRPDLVELNLGGDRHGRFRAAADRLDLRPLFV